MEKIFKYQLMVANGYTLCVHEGFKPLSIDKQNGDICMWAMIDDSKPLRHVRIHTVGTGHPIPDGATYIDTIMDDEFVWHFFYEEV